MARNKTLVTVLSLALLSFGMAACGNGDSDTTTDAATAAGDDEGQIVKAELGESGSKYFVKVDKNKVKAGKVTFEVTNVGELYHEFIVYLNEDGIPPGDLPIASDEDVADLAEESIIGEAPYAKPPIVPSDREPGAEDHRIRGGGWGAKLTVDLEPGKYILLCNLEGHYSKFKQYVAFTVE